MQAVFCITTKKGGLQSRVAKLLKALIPNDFPGLFRRRLRDLELDEAAIQHFVSQPLGTLSLEFKDIFSSLPLSAPMAILRTWSNGWFTTTRMHESEVFPCIFGCDANDSLHHYLRCEVLWTLIYSCTKCKYSFVPNHLMRKLAFAMFPVRIAPGCLHFRLIIPCGNCTPTPCQMQFAQGLLISFWRRFLNQSCILHLKLI